MSKLDLIIIINMQLNVAGHLLKMSLVVRKPFYGVSDQVRYKPGCTATEDG